MPTLRVLAPLQILQTAPPIAKHCSCGAQYTQSEWDRLSCRGIQTGPRGDLHELRDCQTCHSTISLRLPPPSLARDLAGAALEGILAGVAVLPIVLAAVWLAGLIWGGR
jgi:hypothetical protein